MHLTSLIALAAVIYAALGHPIPSNSLTTRDATRTGVSEAHSVHDSDILRERDKRMHLAKRADLETPASLRPWLAKLVHSDSYYAHPIPLEPTATGPNPLITRFTTPSGRITIKRFMNEPDSEEAVECRVKTTFFDSGQGMKVIDSYYRLGEVGRWEHVEFTTTQSGQNPQLHWEGPWLTASTILSLHINAARTAYVPVSYDYGYVSARDLPYLPNFSCEVRSPV